jgi:dipeptidyl aminopeptidase/acylaminoacyl peptidase
MLSRGRQGPFRPPAQFEAMMKRTILLVALLVQASSPGFAQKRAFTIEDVYRVTGLGDLRVSPDGKSVLYTVTTSDLARARRTTHVWTMDADGGNDRQITFSEKSDYAPSYSPDGQWIAFVSTRSGDANLHLMPRSGGESRALTKISTGVSDPVWSPDGRWIAFSTDVYPECGADEACNKKIADRWRKGPLNAHMADRLLYRHWTSWKDGTRTHIFLVDVATGALRDVTPGDEDSLPFQLGGPVQYDFSPDSTELVLVSKRVSDPASSTNNDLWLLPVARTDATLRNITGSNPGYDGSPLYSPDGQYIAYRMQKQPGYESDLFRLALYDRKSGASRVLTESFRNWINDFQWAPDSRAIYFLAEVDGETPLHRLDVETGRVTQVLAQGTIDGFALTPAADRVFFVSRSVGRPQEIHTAALASASPAENVKALTAVNAPLAGEVDIRPAESMRVEGALGAQVEVFIVKPHGFDPSRKYPLILNVHGGPQQQWTDGFRGDWQVYPGAGYVVAFANPHGSTGYGQEFTAQISGDWGGAVYEDLMRVADALAKLPYVDAARMGGMGWSYGGYMMNWIAGHSDRFKALASMMGLYDLRSFYGATEELWFPEWDLKGTPWTSPLYERWSPSGFVKGFKTPTLVITGERDYRVPYTQSLQFFTALQKMGVPSRLIVYADAGHWPSWYEMALYYTAHLEWFHEYLGGDPPPWTTEAFLRNAVFDKETGKRIDEKPVETAGR